MILYFTVSLTVTPAWYLQGPLGARRYPVAPRGLHLENCRLIGLGFRVADGLS